MAVSLDWGVSIQKRLHRTGPAALRLVAGVVAAKWHWMNILLFVDAMGKDAHYSTEIGPSRLIFGAMRSHRRRGVAQMNRLGVHIREPLARLERRAGAFLGGGRVRSLREVQSCGSYPSDDDAMPQMHDRP